MKMNGKIVSENLAEMVLEHNFCFQKSSSNGLINRNICSVSNSDFGEINSNESSIKGISILEWEAHFSGNMKLSENMENQECFCLNFNLGNGYNSFVDNKLLSTDRESHNLLLFKDSQKGYMEFSKNKVLHTYSIMFEKDYLHNLVNRYPDLLSNIFLHYSDNATKKWHQNDIPLDTEVIQIIHKIKSAEVMGDLAPMYIEGKVMELLALQLRDCLHCKSIENCCSYCKNVSDVEKMHEAKAILCSDLNNPPTAYELSRQVGVNEKKLKYGFKEVFNQTIYGCLLEYKMKKAKQLLLDTNKQITDVAYECGYDYPSYFVTAFKRSFGIPPAAYRRKRVG